MLFENLTRLHAIADTLDARLADVKLLLGYLLRYDYLKIDPLGLSFDLETVKAKITAALRDFQNRAGLLPGGLDATTLAKLTEPRCGCSDTMRVGIEAAKWRKNSLKYFVASYVNGLSKADQDDLIRLAWSDWMAVAGITLAPVLSQNGADIVISTGRGAAQQFDGGGGTLAWAFLPPGDDRPLLMRFDLDERWMKDNPQGGILYRNVACHEFGHLLGLDHSRASSALMAPFYSPGIMKPQANDDVPRIQALYGAATTPPAPMPPTPTPPPANGKTIVTLEVEGKTARVVSVV